MATAEAIKSNEVNHKALRGITARIIDFKTIKNKAGVPDLEIEKANATDKEPGKSEALPDDPFSALQEQGRVIEPPFDMLTLATLPEHSTELNQCVEAMQVNIDGTGHRFPSRLKLDELLPVTPTEESRGKDGSEPDKKKPALSPEMQKLTAAARVEKTRLINFFEYATDESFEEFRKRIRRDIETTGNAYIEVLRSPADNSITAFNLIPAYQMRIGKLDMDQQMVTRKVLELQVDGSIQVKERKEWRRFRRFVQSRAIHVRRLSSIQGHRVAWFKQFGDDRRIDKNNGNIEGSGVEDGVEKVDDKDLATEIIHLKLYSSRSPYGLPRFIGNLLSIFGDRAAEEINYVTFRNNNIPSMVVAVSNGMLTEGTIDRIESFVESQIQGSDNYSKFLIIEAEPAAEEGDDGGQVKLDITPLTTSQHNDALFQEYSKNNQDKIRRAFRLPPIFVGKSDDYTRATAESSRRLADEQIFGPEREEWDRFVNRILFPEMGFIYHKFKSNSPNTTDNTQLVKILQTAEKTGGMTPRIARQILEDVLGIDLPEFPQDFPADTPFSLTMAEAVKSEADATEPGQTVTALKALGIIGEDDEVDADEPSSASMGGVVKKLFALQKGAEAAWRMQQAAVK